VLGLARCRANSASTPRAYHFENKHDCSDHVYHLSAICRSSLSDLSLISQRLVAHLSATCRSSLSDSSLISQRPSHRSYTSDSLVSAFACSDRLALSLVVYSLVERLGRWCKARGSTSHYLQHICLISFAHLHWGFAGRALGPPLIQRCRSVAVCLQTFLLICYPTCCTRAG
jgi:hypothetical protein